MGQRSEPGRGRLQGLTLPAFGVFTHRIFRTHLSPIFEILRGPNIKNPPTSNAAQYAYKLQDLARCNSFDTAVDIAAAKIAKMLFQDGRKAIQFIRSEEIDLSAKMKFM